MAKTTITTDDFDGSSNAQPVTFAFDGTTYSIDLSRKNRTAFEKALKPYIAAATKVGRSTTRKPASRRRGPDLSLVRAWAVEQGIAVSERGRIAQDVVDAYTAAH